MATRDITTEDRARSSRMTRDEAKPSFMTTEFYSFIAAVAAILVAALTADNFDAARA